MFNGADFDRTRLYVQKYCGTFIIAVLEGHGLSETWDKDENMIGIIHTDSVKELEITPGPSNETEAKDIQDKTGFKYMNWSIPRCHLRSHSTVCIKNNLFIVGIGPILNKEI